MIFISAGGTEFFKQANEDTVVILLLETAKAFENLDEIVSVPGVDIAWMGHYDLTVSMGIPAQFEHLAFPRSDGLRWLARAIATAWLPGSCRRPRKAQCIGFGRGFAP